MKTYKVSWTVEVEADSMLDAAIEAEKMQRNPASIAKVFEVRITNPTNSDDIFDHLPSIFDLTPDEEL